MFSYFRVSNYVFPLPPAIFFFIFFLSCQLHCDSCHSQLLRTGADVCSVLGAPVQQRPLFSLCSNAFILAAPLRQSMDGHPIYQGGEFQT